MKILIINGPNLNLLGTREPDIYGTESIESYFSRLKKTYRQKAELSFFQSNHEGEIIDKIHESDGIFDGVVLNAAAYTHTSIAIGDAVKSIAVEVVEVHISNPVSREHFRKNSYIAPNAKGVIAGFGLKSYELAVQYFLSWGEDASRASRDSEN